MFRFLFRHKLLLALLLFTSACCGAMAGGIFAFMRDLPQIRSLEDFRPSAVTRVYSADRTLLSELYIEKRDPVPLHAIPDYLKKALVTTEDRQFYSHSGIDLKGIARAILRDILAGEFVEGASTITQQLTKTLFLTPRKTVRRKIKEAILAFQLERRYTKDEILSLYLNQVYFGSGAYGVQAAAQRFFGKRIGDLDLAECALIAAMPKAPSRFSPLVNPVLAVERRNIVLKQMRRTGIITTADYRKAVEAPLDAVSGRKTPRSAPYFVDYIKTFLESTVGSSGLYKGGLTVATTLDAQLQAAADSAVENGLAALTSRMEKQGLDPAVPQGALVCIDARTGAILSMVGGRSYTESSYNRAADARRQPGSAFKPVVYACAVEKGMAQNRLLLDAPVLYKGALGGRDWRPENFSRTYQGEMTIRKALALSKNIPAVRLIEMLGASAVVRFAHAMGIRSRLSPNLSLALGTSETTLLELTAAYAVFPNRGERAEPYCVQEVLDRSGRRVWGHRQRKTVVMSRAGAAIMVDLLQAVVTEGTGKKAARLPHPVAGKTGTTNDCKDALFIGFSPDLAVGVWVGQDRFATLGHRETGAKAALPIWTEFMTRALATRPYPYFDMPDGVERVLIDPDSGKKASEKDAGAVSVLLRRDPDTGPR